MNNEETNTNDKPKAKNQTEPFGNKKVFDVVRPGKAPASPTSRPVIVGHKPQVKDDQFVPSADSRFASENPFDDHNLMSHKSVNFDKKDTEETPDEPPAPADESAATETDDKPVAPDVPEVPEVPAEDVSKPASVTPLDEVAKQLGDVEGVDDAEPTVQADVDDDDSADSSTAPEISAPAETKPDESAEPKDTEPSADPKPEPADVPEEPVVPEADEAKKPELPVEEKQVIASEENASSKPSADADVDELPQLGPDDVVAATGAPVIDHAFVVHHKQHTKWWEWLIIFLLIIVLAAVALNFMLDANVINTNLNIPHTNLIK